MTKQLILKGMGVSAGTIQGKVCVILSEKDFGKLRDGDILVTPITDPGMTMLINQCAGIICDKGGMTSHPAIIARELGIPAVVATNNATILLRDGTELFMDGATGEIFIETA